MRGLNGRLVRVAERLGAQPGASIPVACGGWAETQAAYRLLVHEAVDWEAVLAPHWECSLERTRGRSVVLCVQDSTALGCTVQPGIAGLGPPSYLRQHGLHVHPTLTVTPDGVPPGAGYLDVGARPGGLRRGSAPKAHRGQGEHALAGRLQALRRTGREPARHPPSLCRRPGVRHPRVHGPGAAPAAVGLADPHGPGSQTGRKRPALGAAGASAGLGRGDRSPSRPDRAGRRCWRCGPSG
ncbi:MAG: transposase [Candidatus Competibacter sp.]|nr:transposase [Candidatus Competibacter sp.]